MSERITLSVVMPSFNEERAVGPMIESIRTYSRDFDTEIVVVDSSNDRTPDIAASMGARVIRQKPQGHGIALRTALLAARHDIIITTDCDTTYPMEYIPRLVTTLTQQGYDIISCNRLTRQLGQEMPLTNKLANKGFAFLVRLLYGIQVHDVTTGMFCMRQKVAKSIDWETNYAFPCEMIIRANRAGFRHTEMDIPYRMRIGEVTLHKWRSGKAYIRCIFKYRFNLAIPPSKL
ncbi:MAG: glycosyltransferase family 2 protein [Desulfobacterota bacterium]|nr:glycosyltransferase family 2 protein [Thermodesulfobacteriota bacterium]